MVQCRQSYHSHQGKITNNTRSWKIRQKTEQGLRNDPRISGKVSDAILYYTGAPLVCGGTAISPSGVLDLVDQVISEYIDGPISQYFIPLATLTAIVDDQNIGSIQAGSQARG